MDMENLDLIDRKILSYLDQDARITYSALGKKIRVARETVKYRIKKLEQKGIITGYYAVMNFSKMGYQLYRLYIRLQNTDPLLEKEMLDYLAKSKAVFILFRVNGPFHIALGALVKDVWDFQDFYSEFKARFGTHISENQVSVMSNYTEFTRQYLCPSLKCDKKMFHTIGRTKTADLDKLDIRLLRFISNNGRASLISMGKHLNISPVSALYRLKQLKEKEVILGFRPMLSISNLGREYYKVDIYLSKHDRIKEIQENILSIPEVIYTESTTHPCDLEVDVEVKGFKHFISIMETIKKKFSEDIRDYNYYSRVLTHKISYAPGV